MIASEVPIAEVVELLAQRWRARCREMDVYLRATFGIPAPAQIPTRLHLSQMADGTIRPQDIGHNFARVWLITADEVREVPLNFEWQTRWETDESDSYYLMHSYSFVAEGDEVLLSERYGPGLVHRWLGRLVFGSQLSAAWSTCWHTGHDAPTGKVSGS